MKKNLTVLLLFVLTSNLAYAADGLLPNEGKMLPTIIVLVIVLLGITAFLIFLDQKIRKLENTINNES